MKKNYLCMCSIINQSHSTLPYYYEETVIPICTLATLLLLPGCKQEKKLITDLPRKEATPEVIAAVDSFVHATQTRPVAPDSITLHSIMILKHGEVVYQNWFNGQTAETPHPMFSVSKTFTAVAVGLAINEVK